MNQGSRYNPLFEHLKRSGEAEVTLSFAELEALLGRHLPGSARTARAWWSNRDSGIQAAAWMQAGYRVQVVDLEAERVTFRKHRVEYRINDEGEIQWDGQAIRALRTYMGLNQTRFADELGVRQQTVSEWEQGIYSPTRATVKHLIRVAKEAGFSYTTEDNATP